MTGRRSGHTAAVLTAMAALCGLLLGSLAVAANQHPDPPTYCQQVGDDDCDGMIVPSESGWRCVPSDGGPLLCHVDHRP
jgi:hypothetical protein